MALEIQFFILNTHPGVPTLVMNSFVFANLNLPLSLTEVRAHRALFLNFVLAHRLAYLYIITLFHLLCLGSTCLCQRPLMFLFSVV